MAHSIAQEKWDENYELTASPNRWRGISSESHISWEFGRISGFQSADLGSKCGNAVHNFRLWL
jgi:hypothetical protein